VAATLSLGSHPFPFGGVKTAHYWFDEPALHSHRQRAGIHSSSAIDLEGSQFLPAATN
jgi:hypothetical protein